IVRAPPPDLVVCHLVAAARCGGHPPRGVVAVARLQPLDLGFRVMSLSVLSEYRDLEPGYREFNDRAWCLARLGTAAEVRHGNTVLRELFTALGSRIHVQRDQDSCRVEAGTR
ncbi:hypothetical protein ABT144_36960, partial [Streptomyces sp. NPDC002039]